MIWRALKNKLAVSRYGESGITLVELLIGTAISGIVVGVGMMAFQQLQSGQKQISENLAATGVEAIGNRQFWADSRKAGVSFNLLRLPGDNVAGDPMAKGGNFFDHLPDYNCRGDNCARKITLRPGGGELVLALTRGGLSAPSSITPSFFYTAAARNTICVGSNAFGCPGGTLIPDVNLNWNNLMARLAAVDNIADVDAPDSLVKKNQLLWFYSPLTSRPTPGFANPDMNTAPQRLSFVGKVAADRSKVDPFTLGTTLPLSVRPGSSPAQSVADLDKFFRWMPAAGGANSFAMVVPISFVRYRVVAAAAILEGRQVAALVRDVFDPADNQWKFPRNISMPVESVEVMRPSISSASIKAKINLDVRRHIGGHDDARKAEDWDPAKAEQTKKQP